MKSSALQRALTDGDTKDGSKDSILDTAASTASESPETNRGTHRRGGEFSGHGFRLGFVGQEILRPVLAVNRKTTTASAGADASGRGPTAHEVEMTLRRGSAQDGSESFRRPQREGDRSRRKKSKHYCRLANHRTDRRSGVYNDNGQE